MTNLTATEVKAREKAYWDNYKTSPELLAAEEKMFEPILKKMEEMANAPSEEMGKRSPGEKGAYETPVRELYVFTSYKQDKGIPEDPIRFHRMNDIWDVITFESNSVKYEVMLPKYQVKVLREILPI